MFTNHEHKERPAMDAEKNKEIMVSRKLSEESISRRKSGPSLNVAVRTIQ